jgi:hypothetical protein
MSYAKLACVVWMSLVGGCSSRGVPVEAPVNGNALTIVVPKDLEHADTPLKGVAFEDVDRLMEQKPVIGTFTRNSIRDFFSVKSSFPRPGTFVTQACQGEQYEDGKRYSSCVGYQARLEVAETPDGFRISITPVKMITQQGRNVLGVGLDLPRFDISDWYSYVMAQRVSGRHKVTSKFTPEAMKAAFDRHFKKQAAETGTANAALRQFTDTYERPVADGTKASIVAAFSPYQDGAVAECEITLSSEPASAPKALDWAAALATVRQDLEQAATE